MKGLFNVYLSNARLMIILGLTFTFAFCNRTEQISLQEYENIQEGFITPADTNTLWCYYYWIEDDISKEGITKDLEAMKEFGLGTVLIGNINPPEENGPVPLFSDAWWDAMVHVVEEGHRLGIDVGMFNCPGWSQSGGPWVTYDKAMRHLVYSEATVHGTGEVSLHLEKPADEFQDTYVLAFNKIEAEKHALTGSNASVSCTPTVSGADRWLDGDENSSALFNIETGGIYTIVINADEPITARSILITPAIPTIKCDIELQAELDGSFKTLKRFVLDRSNDDVNVGPLPRGKIAESFPAVTAARFRLRCTNLTSPPTIVQPVPGERAGFAEIEISEAPVLQNYIEKSLGKMHPTPFPAFDSYLWESQEAVDDKGMLISEVLDLSAQMDPSGTLTWDVPDGEWTVIRMGMTPTGTRNAPAAPQGKGYEIDKASATLAQYHFDQYMAKLIERIPAESRPALKYVIADSYEQGSQNWSDGYAEKFEKKYGYDPVKFLPVLSGRIVGSVEESDRFLWDLRRMVADDVAYEYVGGLRRAANEYGMKTWLENYGHWGYPGEFLMYGGQSDLVAGEFWNEGDLGNIECKTGSSAAHMYGKPITSAEAFTAGYQAYKRHPAQLKKRGDWSWTEGINHFVLHLYIQQPRDEAPGINAWFSTEFNRLNTWFEQGKAWADYARRCQHMLQQGTYAADVLYFIGEDTPKMTGTRDPELPVGYSYDYINAEVIMERLSVEEGKFVLPDGMTYSILVLPDKTHMRPAVLARMEELVQAGGTILGGKPGKSPSLQNYPQCDSEIGEIAERMWGESYEGGKLEKKTGDGYVLDGMGLQEALDLIRVAADIQFDAEASLLWTHRTLPGMEIYFLTNQADGVLNVEPSFNVTGFQPQLWDAVTGEVRLFNDYTDNGSRTTVPLRMRKDESAFIVFTAHSTDETGSGYQENSPEPEQIATLDGEWSVEFENKEFGPIEPLQLTSLVDWSESAEEKMKYYSGTATYKTEFNLDELPEGDLFINLGEVGVMARVILNDEELGVSWMAPFRLRAMDYLVAGSNRIEVEVVNVWRNRMVGDMSLSEDERFTTYTVADLTEGEDLAPSGLMGPVTIEWISK
ncbi:MAG: glycosyl hydrolase [Bacteroidota bacterium]